MDIMRGYDYIFNFRKADEIVDEYDVYDSVPGFKILLLQIRTQFMVKGSNDETKTLSTEKFNVCTWETPSSNAEKALDFFVRVRLEDYWMPDDRICRFVKDACDFARANWVPNSATPHYPPPGHPDRNPRMLYVVPVVADLEVRTVQLDDEPLRNTELRSIREELLVPLHLSAFHGQKYTEEVLLSIISPKIRVKAVDEVLHLMQECPFCKKGPSVGTQISILRGCRHVVHSHCLACSFKTRERRCPVCNAQYVKPGGEVAY